MMGQTWGFFGGGVLAPLHHHASSKKSLGIRANHSLVLFEEKVFCSHGLFPPQGCPSLQRPVLCLKDCQKAVLCFEEAFRFKGCQVSA